MSRQIPPTRDPPPAILPESRELVRSSSQEIARSPRNNFSIGNFSRGIFCVLFGPGIFFGTALNFAFIYVPTKFLYVVDLKSRKTAGSVLRTFFSDDRFLEGVTKFFEGAFGFGAKKFLKDPYQDLFQESKNLITSFSPSPTSFEQLDADRDITNKMKG